MHGESPRKQPVVLTVCMPFSELRVQGCREKALHHRRMLLFRPSYSSSSGTFDDKASWPWMARPRSIQKHSAGLGMYFRTMLYFCAIMLLLAAVAVVPLVSNISNQNFSNVYDLVVTEQPGTAARFEVQCSKSFQVRFQNSTSGGSS